MAARQAPEWDCSPLERKQAFRRRVPRPRACRCPGLPARRRGLLGQRLLRRARAARDHLRGRRTTDRLGESADPSGTGRRLAALELPRRQRGRELQLAAEDLDDRAPLHRAPRPDRDRGAAPPRRRQRLPLLRPGHQRRPARSRQPRGLAPLEGERREPDQGGKARTRARQPPLPQLPRQLGLPNDHAARLQPALLAQAARTTRTRADELRQAAPLPLHPEHTSTRLIDAPLTPTTSRHNRPQPAPHLFTAGSG